MIVSETVPWEAGAQVEVVLEAALEGLADQALVPVAAEALPAWEASVAVVAAAAAALVAADVAVVAADVAAAEAEGGKSHEKDQHHGHNKSFTKRPILVLSNWRVAARWSFGNVIGPNW